MEWIDLHCHVLPGMDDGCATPEESCALMAESRRQGVAGIAATPHYYPRETVESFLVRREAAVQRLGKALASFPEEVPQLCLGAEVAYRPGISKEPELNRLCYGASGYLLLELPFTKWEASVLRDIEIITQVQGLCPIIAHVERYMKYQDRRTMQTLLDMDVLIQTNAEYLLNRWTQHKAKGLIRSDIVQLLGSDAHGMERRPQNLGAAEQKLRRSGLWEEMDRMKALSWEIFRCARDE